MGPRKVHKLRVGKYMFIREFLSKEWSVVNEERGNGDTFDNASIDAVWDSFQYFLEINGYSQDFCSKILLGKLLHDAGVEKVKRGPRKKQKFYYFPLKPVAGSRAESIVATRIDARFNNPALFSNLKKMKPEYYTLRSSSLGRVSVSILYDRSITPEKYAARALKKKLSAKQNKVNNTKKETTVVQPKIQTKVEQLAVSDVNESCNPHPECSIQTSIEQVPVPDICKQPALGGKCSAPEVAVDEDPKAVKLSALKSETSGKNPSLIQSQTSVGDDLNEIPVQSIAGIYEAENVNKEYPYSQDNMYLSNWQDCFNQALKAPQPSLNIQPSVAAGFDSSVPSTSALGSLSIPFTSLPGQDAQNNATQQWQNNLAQCATDPVSGQVSDWQSNGTVNFPSNFPLDWQPCSQSNPTFDWHQVSQSNYSMGWQSNSYSSCAPYWPSNTETTYAGDWNIGVHQNDAPVCYPPDWNPTGASAQLLQSTPDHYYHVAQDWKIGGEAAFTPYTAVEDQRPNQGTSQSTTVQEESQRNGIILPVKAEKRKIGRPKELKNNPDTLKTTKQQRHQARLVSKLQPTKEVSDSVKGNKVKGKRLLCDKKNLNNEAENSTKKRSSSKRDTFSLLNLDAGTSVQEIPWKLTADVKNRQVDPITGKRPRGRPKGSKNKKPSKKAILSNPSGITSNEVKAHSTALTVNKPPPGVRSFVSTDFKNWSKRGRKPKRTPKPESEVKDQDNNKENDRPFSYGHGPNHELKHNRDLFGVYAAEPFSTLPFNAYPITSQSSYGLDVRNTTGETLSGHLNETTGIQNPSCVLGGEDGQAPSLVTCTLPTIDVYGLADWSPFPELL